MTVVVSVFVVTCDDDAADCGGDKNVLLCETMGTSSGSEGAETGVKRLNHSVRNFP